MLEVVELAFVSHAVWASITKARRITRTLFDLEVGDDACHELVKEEVNGAGAVPLNVTEDPSLQSPAVLEHEAGRMLSC